MDRHKSVMKRPRGERDACIPINRSPAPLATTFANCYSDLMLPEKTRRISALLSAFALAVGLVTHGFAGQDMGSMGFEPATATASEMPMSVDMPMPGKCDGCVSDQKGVALAACSAFCGAVIAAPSAIAVIDAVPIATLSPSAALIVTGHADPPDPYPPRPTILS